MDPNENIKRQRELAAQILRLRTIEELQDNCESMRELAELVQALDEWRLKGGFDPYPPVAPRSVWEDNSIQFPRLLAEIVATQEGLDIDALCESMDLESGEIEELFDRAQAIWDQRVASGPPKAMTPREQALKLCELLNAGAEAHEALTLVGLDEEDVSYEDDLGLDDPDNNIIDSLWRDGELYLLRRGGRRGAKTPWRVELTTEVTE